MNKKIYWVISFLFLLIVCFFLGRYSIPTKCDCGLMNISSSMYDLMTNNNSSFAVVYLELPKCSNWDNKFYVNEGEPKYWIELEKNDNFT